MPQRPPIPPSAARASRPRGFTLIEMLVVIGIIVLLIAIALPAFNFLTGSRSNEAASNLLSSALGVARNNALGLQQPEGVVVFHSNVDDRDVVALVDLRVAPFGGYQSGTPDVPIAYRYGQYTVSGTRMYVCKEAYQDTTATDAPTTNTDLWTDVGPTSQLADGDVVLEFVPGGERQLLPTGIDCRGVGNLATVGGTSSAPAVPTGSTFRYFAPAAVVFDGFGQLAVRNFKILPKGLLGSEIKEDTGSLAKTYFIPPRAGDTGGEKSPYFSNVAGNNLSQIGFVLYDGAVFRSQTQNLTATADVDTWIDNNATPTLVNRYNGTLVRGE